MILTKDRVMLSDGAVGTEFMKLGLKPGDSTAEWNLIKPDCVRAVAASYAEIGSEIVLTNTFGANRFQLERHGLAQKAGEINRAGAMLTREACAGRALVSGCLGPSGKLLVMEEVTEEALYESFLEQAETQKEGGADLFTVMTMTDVSEMEIAVRAAVSTGLPVIASMTYEYKNGEYRTIMGNTPEQAVKAAAAAGARAVGANCGYGLDNYVELAPILRGLTDLPVYIKGNAGLPELVDGKSVYRMSPDDFVSYVPKLLENGVTIIGGCCGTGPDYIKKLKPIVDEWNSSRK
ncbi:MAG: homocysteine S-methyltransferase family protein [Treponema sp.]|jgi:5-methyltetrahydrofolate--homocysteine methyltransferase|nr:homocysteine S-methyltransferase family protein [Treponema sp.]